MRTRLLVLSSLLGIVTGVISASRQFLPVLLDQPVSTIGLVFGVVSVVAFLVSPVGIFTLGYWAGSSADVDVAHEYGTLALAFGLGGGLGSLVGYAGVAGVGLGARGGAELLSLAVPAAYNTLVRVADFAVTGLAGAAVAHFRQ